MFRTIQRGALALLGLLALGVLAFNSFGVEPAVRLALSRIETRTGTQASFEAARGNVLTGALSVDGLRLHREEEGRNHFEVTLGHLTADVSVLRFFDPDWRFDAVSIVGLEGEFTSVRRAEGAAGELGKEGALGGTNLFEVAALRVRAVDLRYRNRRDPADPLDFHVEIEELAVDEYRSAWSLHDLLFSSTLKGSIDGHLLEVTRAPTEDAEVVRWKVRDFPAGKWTRPLTGPLSFIRSGTIDADVVTRWPRHDPRVLSQSWSLALSDVEAAPRRGASLLESTMVPMIVTWLRDHADDAAIEFPCELSRGDWEGAQSLGDAGLWEAVSRAGGDHIVDEATRGLSDALDRLGDGMRGLFGG